MQSEVFTFFALLCSQNSDYIEPDNRVSYSSGTRDSSNKRKRQR